MDQRERVGDYVEGVRSAIDGRLADTWTALPGIVQSVNFQKMTCVVQPTLRVLVTESDGTQTWIQLPQLLDVPIVFPAAGGFVLTLPLEEGDEVLVIFAARCIDAWWQNGGVQNQVEFRMHDLSDGFAIPGPRSVPNAVQNISAMTAQLRTVDGSAYIELTKNGAVNIVAPNGVNITGDLDVSGEGTFKDSHTVTQHIHGGVQSGGADTDTPTG